MGFDSFFFGRIDYADKALRLNKSEMEIIWQGSQSLGSASDIFTGVLYNHYDPPTGFCFDIKCDNPPIQVMSTLLCNVALVQCFCYLIKLKY